MQAEAEAPVCAGGRRQSRFGAGERGASMAEFALLAPVLLTIVFGIFEFGIAFQRAQAVEAAAREGARLASISSTLTLTEVQNRVNDSLNGISFQVAPVATWNPGSCDGREGQTVTVTVTTPHNIDIPLLGTVGTANLSGEAVFRCEA